MIEKKAGVQKQNSRKDLKRMSMPAAWREFCGFPIALPVHIYLMMAGSIRNIQS